LGNCFKLLWAKHLHPPENPESKKSTFPAQGSKPTRKSGYPKKVANRPDWIKANHVNNIFSASGCISEVFADYINFWKHNGYWLFDSPEIIEEIAVEEKIDLSKNTLFYYEAYEMEFNDKLYSWSVFAPVIGFKTNIILPIEKQLRGFDVCTFSCGNKPECSPLSCNSLSETLAVNEHCLFDTFKEAKEAIESGRFNNSEPGPYRILAVYTTIHNPARKRSI
jgi:hypothetical protein